jgi:hypothetical protein
MALLVFGLVEGDGPVFREYGLTVLMGYVELAWVWVS